ncbi:MAG: hypothetical protein ACM3YM_02830 [Sphingomonadales bacterium]
MTIWDFDRTHLRPVVREIDVERDRQDAKWGQQNHPDGAIGREIDVREAARAKTRCQGNAPGEDNWRDILEEEITEAYAAQSPAELRAELVQVAAVCVAWIEAIDRRG